ncbi:hypothetical protein BFP72_07630 [Reichenbachiella sp. 5M10]|uniref:hypothetical protein n=1 Tax=Reichenbachiella sp. 5M10 TaxID=1889772 RepID=UPI000C149D1E|nr:hypothetical protein [Reichenbachiella sp. 5M10]PIB35277.1 hypothetical protein BFP72_07630 [Reichenbachiella sp. 5M10]
MNILDKIKDRRVYQDHDTQVDDPEEAQIPSNKEESIAEVSSIPSTRVDEVDLDLGPESTLADQESVSVDDKPLENVSTPRRNQDETTMYDKVRTDVNCIATHIMNKGKSIPKEAARLLNSNSLDELILAHGIMCEAIHPSMPESILYLDQCSSKSRGLFSPIPLVRNFIFIAILAIGSLLGIGLSADVSSEVLSKGILDNSGWPLLKNLIFICSGACVGTIFFLLSKLTKEVKEATLVRGDATYYWIMLIMGMLSGLIMSEVIVINKTGLEGDVEMNRLIFALLGGFSSEVVYGILQTVMNKISSIFTS